jgi:Transposase DDE domain
MPPAIEPTMSALIAIVTNLPIGTNLSMLHFMWMLVSGSLLPHRGAIFPALQSTGIGKQAVRRAWGGFHSGMWQISELMVAWDTYMREQQRWQPRRYEGYYAIAIDTTPFWRPKLKGLFSKYYNSAAEKALPAVVLGLVARIGEVEGKRIALPQSIVRVHPKDPSENTLKKELLKQVRRILQPLEIMLADAGFKIKSCHEANVEQYMIRLAKNFTARRNYLAFKVGKKGKKPRKGPIVRPLPRKYNGKEIAGTPPDATFSWELESGETITVQAWYDLVRTDVELDLGADLNLFDVFAITDPRYDKPMLVATNVKLQPQTIHALYSDRWPIEQLPLAAKQMVGAHRQFVFAAETRHRLPELVILAGSILTCLAALHPTMPTGFWDRNPQPTPGRFRRALAGLPFPQSYPLPGRIRQKASVTDHLPKGILGHRRIKQVFEAVLT